jgi:signal peptidase II
MFKWFGLGAFVLSFDLITKSLVVNAMDLYERIPVWSFFSWLRTQNDGVAFSQFSGGGGRWIFVVLALGFSIFLIREIVRMPKGEILFGLAYGFLLGGALGNGIDRALNGYVVDFIFFHYGDWGFPVFNVADIAINIGAFFFILTILRDWRAKKNASGGDGERLRRG